MRQWLLALRFPVLASLWIGFLIAQTPAAPPATTILAVSGDVATPLLLQGGGFGEDAERDSFRDRTGRIEG